MKIKLFILLIVNLCSLLFATAQIADKHLSKTVDEWTAENNKEKFTQKLERFKANGHLVAVTFSCPDTIRVDKLESYLRNQPGYGQLAPNAMGNYVLFDEKRFFLQIQDKILDKLKTSFDPDLFVKLDENEIPEISHGFDTYRDYWKTKYKVVVNIWIWPSFAGYTNVGSDKNVEVYARFHLAGAVYINEYQVKKGKEKVNSLLGIIPYLSFKGYSSEKLDKTYKRGEEPDNIKFIDPLINRKRGEDLYNAFSADLDNVMNSMIKKLSK